MIRKRYACRTTASRASQVNKKEKINTIDCYNSLSNWHGYCVHWEGAYPHSFMAHKGMGWGWGSIASRQGVYEERKGLHTIYLHSFHDSYFDTTHEAMRRN